MMTSSLSFSPSLILARSLTQTRPHIHIHAHRCNQHIYYTHTHNITQRDYNTFPHIDCIYLSHTKILTLYHTLSRYLSPTYANTFNLSIIQTHTPAHSVTHKLSLSLVLQHTRRCSFSPSLVYMSHALSIYHAHTHAHCQHIFPPTHTHTHNITHYHTFAHTYTLPIDLSFYLSIAHKITLCLIAYHRRIFQLLVCHIHKHSTLITRTPTYYHIYSLLLVLSNTRRRCLFHSLLLSLSLFISSS